MRYTVFIWSYFCACLKIVDEVVSDVVPWVWVYWVCCDAETSDQSWAPVSTCVMCSLSTKHRYIYICIYNIIYNQVCTNVGRCTVLPQPSGRGIRLECWSHPLGGVAVRLLYIYIYIYVYYTLYICIYIPTLGAGRSIATYALSKKSVFTLINLFINYFILLLFLCYIVLIILFGRALAQPDALSYVSSVI